MSERIELSGLNVAVELQHFIETQALPGTGVEPSAFWSGLADIVAKLGPKNAAVLKKRDELQEQIDAWHIERRGSEHKPAQYEQFLRDIGYWFRKAMRSRLIQQMWTRKSHRHLGHNWWFRSRTHALP